MTFQLVCIEPKELTQYKADMQEAFQKGFEDVFGKTDAVILPEKDIDQSLNAEGSAVYKAVVDGEMVGGAVVIINESTQHNHLDLLFVKNGVQSNGIGKKITPSICLRQVPLSLLVITTRVHRMLRNRCYRRWYMPMG